MKRYRTNRVGKLLGFIYGMAFMLACTNETDVPFAGNYRSVELDVKMDVSGFQNPEATRSVNGPLPGDLGEEENAIHNIMAFQFDGTGNDDDPLVIMCYADSNLKDLKLGFMQPIGHEEKVQFIYFIANAGKQLQNFSGTYGQLKQQLIPVNNKGLADGIMLMSATLQTTIKAGNSISVRLVRKLAKINVSCTVEEGSSFTPVRLQLRNVPKSTFLMNTSETTPVTNGTDLQNYWSVTENITEGYTWYMPENLRAAGSASSEKEKTAEVNFEGAYCTYVEISGLYQDESTSKLVPYKVYLGANNTTDYSVEANRIYNVSFSVKGINDEDKRVLAENFPTVRGAANCYMVAPDETVLIDLLASPGTAVSAGGITGYNDRVGTTGENKIKSIGIVWQTTETPDGLIQDLSYFEEKGQAMFKAASGDVAGNLLLAAYSGAGQTGEILWSWHIWVTPYQPDKCTAGSSGGDGNVYSIAGATWMDRDLGAMTATKGRNTTIGYAYQWGRKDPFPLSNNISYNELRPLYDAKGTYLRSGAATEINDTGSDDLVKKAVAHPDVFFTTTEGTEDMTKGNWWKTNDSYSLWSNNNKTMYDPCPAGWRIPSSTVIGSISGVSYDSTNKGSICQGMWYQYCGYMSFMNAGIGEPGVTSVYWSSNSLKAYQMGMGNNFTASVQTRHCGFGFIGRCVKVAP